MRIGRSGVGLLLLGALADPAAGDVTHSTGSGFVVVIERRIEAEPRQAFDALVRRIGSWWHPDHTYSGAARNLSIQPRANGCFCEKLDDGGQIQHMTVAFVRPAATLRMIGGLGPLGPLAVQGAMTVDLSADGDATKLTLTYRVGGWDPDGLERWAAPVDRVLTEQMDRLRRYVETGDPSEQ
jgi:uncharacterized protein YndB with AHSA1/START domain